jgi:hypothetical protein
MSDERYHASNDVRPMSEAVYPAEYETYPGENAALGAREFSGSIVDN